MSTWRIDSRFDRQQNTHVLAFLRAHNPSAHSDVAEELLRSAERVPGVAHYCPDLDRYAFVVLHLADSTIIGLAYGQSGLAYRLPASHIVEAERHGAWPAEEIGAGWVHFSPWSDAETLAESRHRLAHWCSIAARTTPNAPAV
jgi:hypothetical protein